MKDALNESFVLVNPVNELTDSVLEIKCNAITEINIDKINFESAQRNLLMHFLSVLPLKQIYLHKKEDKTKGVTEGGIYNVQTRGAAFRSAVTSGSIDKFDGNLYDTYTSKTTATLLKISSKILPIHLTKIDEKSDNKYMVKFFDKSLAIAKSKASNLDWVQEAGPRDKFFYDGIREYIFSSLFELLLPNQTPRIQLVITDNDQFAIASK